MEKDTQIAKTASRFVDRPYAVDNPKEGYDCLNTILAFFEEMGVKMPHEFEDWTVENYGERAIQDPDKAHKAFERFVQTLGYEVMPSLILRGDILLFSVKELGTYAGIYLGNGNVMIVFDKGVRVSPIEPFRPFIKGVRRLLK